MDEERAAKRTRQACEPCRRKKSKCSGDRPVCQTCRRLRHKCSYPGEDSDGNRDSGSGSAHSPPPQAASAAASTSPVAAPHATATATADSNGWENRISSIESTLGEVLATLKSGHNQSREEQPRSERNQHDTQPIAGRRNPAVPAPGSQRHLWQEAQSNAPAYLKFCDCQPLPLFSRICFSELLPGRKDDVLLSILALSVRFKADSKHGENTLRDAADHANAAQSIVMRNVARGRIEISTLQTLCLLSFLHFHDGRSEMAIPLISLASTLSNGVGISRSRSSTASNTQATGEIARCHWSILLLQRLYGHAPPDSLPPEVAPSFDYLDSPALPQDATSTVATPQVKDGSKDDTSNGILVVVLRLSEVWAKAVVYVKSCFSPDADLDPWSPSSRYTRTMSSLMDISQQLPQCHRYRNFRLRELTSDDLDRHRDYWAPWFLTRFMYHTIVCLLNHPLLVTMQLQGRRSQSELFLQQTSFHVSHHVRWLLHFIAYIQSRDFPVSDPILGYCAAVIATIELQLSFTADRALSEEKRHNFETCLNFVRSFSGRWPSMQVMANKLEAVVETMSVSYESTMTNPDGNIDVDLSQLRKILDFTLLASPVDAYDGTAAFSTTDGIGRRQTQFLRLPPITQPDHSSTANSTPEDSRTNNDKNNTEILDNADSHLVRNEQLPPTQTASASANEFALQAELFFGQLPQESEAHWWNDLGPGYYH